MTASILSEYRYQALAFDCPQQALGTLRALCPLTMRGGSLSTTLPSDDTVNCVLTFAADMNPDVVLRRCLNRPTTIGNVEKIGSLERKDVKKF